MLRCLGTPVGRNGPHGTRRDKDVPMTYKPTPDPKPIPALFATIHFRSDKRPDGYTDDEITELNQLANGEKPPATSGDDGPA